MTKSKIVKSGLQIVVVLLLLVFAIISYGKLSFGWFSSNQKTGFTPTGIRVGSQSDITTLSCYAFKYDGKFGAVCLHVNNHTSISMSDYDAIFVDKNVNTPLFFRVVADHIPTNGAISISIPCSGDYQKDSSIVNVLSNVISVKVGYGLYVNNEIVVDDLNPIQTTERSYEENVKIFEGVRDLMKQNNNIVSDQFVKMVDDEASKTKNIELFIDSSDYGEYMCKVIDNGDGTFTYDYEADDKDALVFYIELDYNADLIETFQKGISQDSVRFTHDIGTIMIEEKRN